MVQALVVLRHEGAVETTKAHQATNLAGKENAMDQEDSALYLLHLEKEHAALAHVAPRKAGHCLSTHTFLMVLCTNYIYKKTSSHTT